MSASSNRRDFLKSAAVAGVGFWVADRAWAEDSKSPNEQISFACIGVGGKGGSDSADAAKFGNIVAICDIDEGTLAAAAKKYPNAKTYTDYRKMFDEMGKSIDAVTVSTPDHHHALAASLAMSEGKHCFCQKPLTHSLYEARYLGELAHKKKVATQMGNQGTADNSMRKNAYAIRGGVLGDVKEVHVWTNRPIWPQGESRPEAATPPETVHWDQWLGPAPERPYSPAYHPFKWRGWWDFGTGALGDMACHTMNLPFMALDLRGPESVQAQTSGHNRDSYPKWSTIRYEFGKTKHRPAVTMYWYDGGKLPPEDLLPVQKLPDSGSLIIGEKGKLYTPGDYGGGGRFIGIDDIGDVQFPVSPGHFQEYVRAIKGGEPAMSNFPDYASSLTETVLLGNLAVWADGQKVEWDSKHLRARHTSEFDAIIHPTFREGWKLY
jgi:predicted dehydrogenase